MLPSMKIISLGLEFYSACEDTTSVTALEDAIIFSKRSEKFISARC